MYLLIDLVTHLFASIPLSISQELENGRIKDDDTLVLVGFGGGLTWGAMVIKWGK